MALTELGYERPTYDDLLERQEARARLLFGNDIDTSQNTALGKYIRLNVEDLAAVYEDNERIYYARFPHTATGISLDRLCPFVGISRNPATYAQHAIRFTGVAGEYVPEAFEVSTADGTLLFHTYESYLIGEDGTVDGVVECETAGVIGNVAIGKIDTIVNPDVNVESIEHIGNVVYAEEIETDAALRKRFDAANSSAGAGTSASVLGAILQVPLVKGASITANNTDETVDGVPPHSFICYVLCPDTQNELVAKAIFSKKGMGIKAAGDITVEVEDENGELHTIGFTKITEVPIYIKITVAVNQYFETDGADQIKANIAEHINAMKNGESVYVSSIYGCIFGADGVVNVSSLEISKDGSNYVSTDIAISKTEAARADTANIEVVIT